MNIQQNISLKTMNTFGIEAKARYFAAIQHPDEFKLLFAQDFFHNTSKLILGEGSNVLFTQDFDGLVIKNFIKGIQVLSEDNDHIWLQAGAGENWHQFVIFCVQHGYGGVENLSLIPGTIGAAPIQNIGAYGVELKDTFVRLEALDLQDGSIHTFTNENCQFGYRDSIFKNHCKNRYAILSVVLKLNKKPTYHLDYGNIQETLQKMNIKEPTLRDISNAVIQIRRSKLPDPQQIGNAGSFFKNPVISQAQFKELQITFPTIPSFSTGHPHSRKIPAAWLIEQCGWKGKRFGEVGIYDKQALILVNYGGGTGDEIKKLAERIQHSVENEFGIRLIPEVNFYPS